MAQKVIVHVGTPKTGTTALQVSFANNQERLLDQSVHYPNITNSGFGWPVARGLSSGNGDIGWKFAWPVEGEANRLQWLIDTALEKSDPTHNILFSSEVLNWLAVKPEFWQVLNATQQSRGCEIEVVAYFRDPFKYFMSSYQQFVKTSAFTGTLGQYIPEFWNSGFPLSFKFQKNILAIQHMAKDANIAFRTFRYEDCAASIENHFYTNILDVDSSAFEKATDPINTSMSAEEIHFHRGVNLVSPKLGQLLGFERSDLKLSALRPPRLRAKTKLLLTTEEQDQLQELFNQYKVDAEIAFDFADRINFTVDRNATVPSLDERETEIADELFNLGVFVATSYSGGYIDWTWKQEATS
jgi:hypothetical protein